METLTKDPNSHGTFIRGKKKIFEKSSYVGGSLSLMEKQRGQQGARLLTGVGKNFFKSSPDKHQHIRLLTSRSNTCG